MKNNKIKEIDMIVEEALEEFFGVRIHQSVKFYKEVNKQGYGMVCHLSDLATSILSKLHKDEIVIAKGNAMNISGDIVNYFLNQNTKDIFIVKVVKDE